MASALSKPIHSILSTLLLVGVAVVKDERRTARLLPPLSLASRMDENENERMRWEIWR